MSNELGMSRIQLYRKVKALTNYSPVEFITLFRLKKAVSIMKMTDTNLAQIAYQVGFSAPSYFSKSFKKYYGKSPSEYLKAIKGV
ncbi:helix-turn-helix transcriptional regulator [uncultured Draconibacterium sp.]|uniref:helix-turn-helix domain-containing protein n=1 Tax=uncultured Draconibacterium sp. TaxID=1573823 RepID=UPI0029C930C2|nr:helix-turn-helix transcriptional regulator [uncultured Draconibacterium sp.]